ncbi:hypothetical protein HDE_02299 [Halotydeus destructor]|nr:hypothetical protein HDE_02299 [Halotydeus destructor]
MRRWLLLVLACILSQVAVIYCEVEDSNYLLESSRGSDKDKEKIRQPVASSRTGNELSPAKAVEDTRPVTCRWPLHVHNGLTISPISQCLAQRPLNFCVKDMILMTCVTSGVRTTGKCLEKGEWSNLLHCPEPKRACPDLDPVENGNISRIEKSLQATVDAPLFGIGTNVRFKCNTGYQLAENQPSVIVCHDQYTWTHPPPKCIKVSEPKKNSKPFPTELKALFIFISIILMSILLVSFALVYRWRKRELQRKRWQRYFGNYSYRQSKTNITSSTSSNQEMKMFREKEKRSIPVTDL